MRSKINFKQFMLMIVILTTGILFGIFSFTGASTYLNQSLAPAPKYPVNEFGQTYGSALYATSLESEPDLIKAYGIDGTHGYVRSSDLNGEQPKTPEEALKQQGKPGDIYKIPLYDVDGKTVIGEFHITVGQCVEQLKKQTEKK